MLVENLSAHPLLRTPLQYHQALADHPELGLCLDLGHAHLLGPQYAAPAGFAALFGTRIRSMHVYETTAARYPRHGHEPANRGGTPAGASSTCPRSSPTCCAAPGRRHWSWSTSRSHPAPSRPSAPGSAN